MVVVVVVGVVVVGGGRLWWVAVVRGPRRPREATEATYHRAQVLARPPKSSPIPSHVSLGPLKLLRLWGGNMVTAIQGNETYNESETRTQQ